jgi:hypothetical protein
MAVVQASRTGTSLAPVAVDNVNGNSFANNGNTLLSLTNQGVTDLAATIHAQSYVDGDASNGLKVPDRMIDIPAGETILCGPFSPDIYNDPSGNVWLDVSGPVLAIAVIVSD